MNENSLNKNLDDDLMCVPLSNAGKHFTLRCHPLLSSVIIDKITRFLRL